MGETRVVGRRADVGRLLASRPDLQPNIIVLSDGKDTKSASSVAAARATVLAAKAVVFGVGVGGGTQDLPDPDGLAALSEASGGLYSAAADVRSLPDVYNQLQRTLQGQYSSPSPPAAPSARGHRLGERQGRVRVDRSRRTCEGHQYPPGHRGSAPHAGFLSGAVGKFMIVGLVLAAAGLLVRAVAMTVAKPLSELETALAPYGDRPEGQLDPEEELGVSLVESQFMKSAVSTARRFPLAGRVVDSLAEKLETANVPLRPEEVAFVYGTAAFLALALAVVFLGPITRSLSWRARCFPGASIVPHPPSPQEFTKQLPEALNLLSGTLARASHSCKAESMASEVGDPMGVELRRVLAEARLGRGLDVALADMATRLRSPDFEWTVMAIGIQREVGGNLAESSKPSPRR